MSIQKVNDEMTRGIFEQIFESFSEKRPLRAERSEELLDGVETETCVDDGLETRSPNRSNVMCCQLEQS